MKHTECISQRGWLARNSEVADGPTITIPVSWLGLEPGDGYADPVIVAAYFRAYMAMHELTVSASTEVLRYSLKKRINETDKKEQG